MGFLYISLEIVHKRGKFGTKMCKEEGSNFLGQNWKNLQRSLENDQFSNLDNKFLPVPPRIWKHIKILFFGLSKDRGI